MFDKSCLPLFLVSGSAKDDSICSSPMLLSQLCTVALVKSPFVYVNGLLFVGLETRLLVIWYGFVLIIIGAVAGVVCVACLSTPSRRKLSKRGN